MYISHYVNIMTFETYRELTEILQATFFPVFTYYLVVYTSLECLKKNSCTLQPPRGKEIGTNHNLRSKQTATMWHSTFMRTTHPILPWHYNLAYTLCHHVLREKSFTQIGDSVYPTVTLAVVSATVNTTVICKYVILK